MARSSAGEPTRLAPTFMPALVNRIPFLNALVRKRLRVPYIFVCVVLVFLTPALLLPKALSHSPLDHKQASPSQLINNLDRSGLPIQMRRGGELIRAPVAVAKGEDQTERTPESTNGAPSVKSVDRRTQAKQRARLAVSEAQELLAKSGTATSDAVFDKYKHAVADFRLAGELREQAKTLRTIGDLHCRSEQYQSSLEYYQKALQLSRLTGDEKQEVDLRNMIGQAQVFLGHNQAAIALFQSARSQSQRVSYRAGEARAVAGIGEAYYNLSDPRSTPALQEALKLWRALDDTRGQAQAFRYLGYVETDSSNLTQALDYYNQALPLWRAAHEELGEAQTINAIALVHTLLGEREEAIQYYAQAESMFRKLGNRQGLATALNGEGNLYTYLDLKHALDCHLEALELCEAIGNVEGQFTSHRFLGASYRALGESSQESADEAAQRYYDQAIDHFEQALRLSHTLGDRRIESYCLQDIAGVYEFKGRQAKALSYYRKSLTLSAQVNDPRGEALALNRLGVIYSQANDIRKALTFLNQALPLTRAAEDLEHESLTLYNLAHVRLEQGDLKTALLEIDTALGIIESLRGKVPGYDLRSSYSASVHEYHQLKVDLLMRLHKQEPDSGMDRKALEQSEAARARSLLDMLTELRAKIRVDVPADLLAEEAELQRALSVKAERQAALLGHSHTAAQAAAADKEIRELTAQYENLQLRIRRQNPRYAALVQPKPLTVNELQQKLLDDDSLLLEYLLGDEKSYLWAVTRNEIIGYELPGRAEIEKEARSLYTLLTAGQPLPGEAFEQTQARAAKANEQLPAQIVSLSRMLLGPVAGKLGTKRLLVVPDGALQYIPFQILTVPAQPRGSEAIAASVESRPLVMDHEIVNEPSASALALLLNETSLRKQAADAVAVFADPVFESDDPRISSAAGRPTSTSTAQLQESESHRALRDVGLTGNGRSIPRLQASRDEADAIMSVAPWWSGRKAIGFEASRAAVMNSNLGRYRIIHFATHGLLNDEHPELSGIVLSLFNEKGEPQDGFLRLYDIYNLKLPVDLVVLSACNTGLGKDVRGEGLIGLTRGFMYAGASSVVASLWKVDDEATAELMRYFYGFMLKDGLSPAAALRKAQVTMSQQKRWQSPYYWSGFIIQGQYNQSEITRSFTYARWMFCLGGLVLLSLATFFIGKRRRRTIL